MIDQTDIPSAVYGQLISLLLSDLTIRRATKYLSDKLVVRAVAPVFSFPGRRDGRSKRETILVTVGSPNYAERQFIKSCKKAGESFPVKKIQLKFVKGK
jgi:hypothetical protein